MWQTLRNATHRKYDKNRKMKEHRTLTHRKYDKNRKMKEHRTLTERLKLQDPLLSQSENEYFGEWINYEIQHILRHYLTVPFPLRISVILTNPHQHY